MNDSIVFDITKRIDQKKELAQITRILEGAADDLYKLLPGVAQNLHAGIDTRPVCDSAFLLAWSGMIFRTVDTQKTPRRAFEEYVRVLGERMVVVALEEYDKRIREPAKFTPMAWPQQPTRRNKKLSPKEYESKANIMRWRFTKVLELVRDKVIDCGVPPRWLDCVLWAFLGERLARDPLLTSRESLGVFAQHLAKILLDFALGEFDKRAKATEAQ